MLTRLKSSLTLRIFLLTFGFIMLACAITYGAIAYLTPISYTALLEEELDGQAAALVADLEKNHRRGMPGDSGALCPGEKCRAAPDGQRWPGVV